MNSLTGTIHLTLLSLKCTLRELPVAFFFLQSSDAPCFVFPNVSVSNMFSTWCNLVPPLTALEMVAISPLLRAAITGTV